jgi:RecA-family ATPase
MNSSVTAATDWAAFHKLIQTRANPTLIERALASLPVIDPRDWQDKPVPEREWLVEGFIPHRTVTLWSGDGGSGKTQTALQLIVAVALRKQWLGRDVGPGPCLLYTAEDEADELHRRLATTVQKAGHELCQLDGVRLIPMAGRDALLAESNKASRIVYTRLFTKLKAEVELLKPRLVVIDPAADVFGGDEINRSQVRSFVSGLSALALECDCAVVLLSHPSLTGLNSGTGTSGSTAWSNSVRSRLYLQAVKDDPDRRVLKVVKANYGRTGEEIKIRWDDGVYVVDTGDDPVVAGMISRKADDVFLAVFLKLTGQGQRLSPKKCSTYAPKKVAEHADAKGYTSQRMAEAMQRLLDDGVLKIETEGPPSRRYDVLVATAN